APPAASKGATAGAIAFALTWFAVLALAMYIGLNDPRQMLAWFVAYPMFALYPGVAALAASRTDSPRLVIAVTVVGPPLVLGWTLLSNAVYGTVRVIDRRGPYFFLTLFTGLALVYGVRIGAQLIRD